MRPFFISIPHSGEQVPVEADWLLNLTETELMCDVDRYVDKLYEKPIQKLNIPFVSTQWHRYAADLNRLTEDVDAGSVEGSVNPIGSFPLGLHWQRTTTGIPLMKKPIPEALHEQIIKKYYDPFHKKINSQFKQFFDSGIKDVYHLDAHSMPSKGTDAHKDPGNLRAEVVISDVNGTSCVKRYADLVMASYEKAGFKVAYNWPYQGGRITQIFGRPDQGQQTLQVELNRVIYMDESTKKIKTDEFNETQAKLSIALEMVANEIASL